VLPFHTSSLSIDKHQTRIATNHAGMTGATTIGDILIGTTIGEVTMIATVTATGERLYINLAQL